MSQINVGYDVNCPQAIDRSYGTLAAGKTVPYASVAAANAAVSSFYRHRGKTVLIDDGSGAREYWWRVDTQDISLVPKILHPFTIDFIIGDGGAFTPAPGTLVYTNPAIKNCIIYRFDVEGAGISRVPRMGSPYVTYDTNAGTETLTNTIFSNDGWYSILLKQL